MNTQADPTLDHFLIAGHDALQRGDWPGALEQFARAVEHEETAEGYEGLGMSYWWLHDAGPLFAARERAYRLYRDSNDRQGAARLAIYIALDYYLFRGERALVNGWFSTAHRLLRELDLCPEHAVILVWEGYVVLMTDHDVGRARIMSGRATELAHQLGVMDYENLARALNGLSLVTAGNIAEGMRLLDEAAVATTSGDMTDLDAIVTTWCFLIYACERVHDFERAVQWCDKARAFSEKWNYRFMFSFCQVHYAAVLIWRGDWQAAEAELLAAAEDLLVTHAAMSGEAFTRLAELRRRQGRLEEAEDLLQRADSHPMLMSAGTAVLLGRAALALDRGNPADAEALAERYLRRVHREDWLERIGGLDILARAQASLGKHRQARSALDGLTSISSTIACPPAEALSRLCGGVVAAAADDLVSARRRFEDAADLYSRHGAPFETALARIELAGVLVATDQRDLARHEVQAALVICRDIGAKAAEERGTALLDKIETRSPASANRPDVYLTPRELEVLKYVAQGMTDREIALQLRISEHTIHRHIGNILTRLDVPSRTAAVAVAARNGLI